TGILVLCLYSPLPLYSVLIFASIAIREIAIIDRRGKLIYEAFNQEYPSRIPLHPTKPLELILTEFKAIAAGKLLVFHNAQHDLEVLTNSFLRVNLTPPRYRQTFCTYRQARQSLNLASHSLEYLAKKLNLKVERRYFDRQQAHVARYDARFTHQLYLYLQRMNSPSPQVNPFSSSRVDHPFQTHPDNASIYEAQYAVLESAIEDIKYDPNRQSKGAVIIGSPGTGKTHLIMRLAQQRLKQNRLLFIPCPNDAHTIKYHTYSSILESLNRPIPGTSFNQLEYFLANTFVGIIKSASSDTQKIKDILTKIADNPLRLYEILGAEGTQTRRNNWDYIEKFTRDWWLQKYGAVGYAPEIIKGIVKFCRYCDPNYKQLIKKWLAADELEPEELAKIGLSSWQAEISQEDFSLEAIAVLGKLSLLHEPLIIVFDQLEMLGLEHNRAILLNFGEAVKELFTRVPHSLISFNLFPDRWQQLQQIFDGSIIDRLAQYQVQLEPPTPEQIEQILQLKAAAVDLELTHLFTDEELQQIISQGNSLRRILNNASEYFRYKYRNVPLPPPQPETNEEIAPPLAIATRLERLESRQERLEQLLTNIAGAFVSFAAVSSDIPAIADHSELNSGDRVPLSPLNKTLETKVRDYLKSQQETLEREYSESEILIDEKDAGKLQDIIVAYQQLVELETDILPSKRVFPPHRLLVNKNLCIAFLSSCKGSKFTSRIQNLNQVVATREQTRFILWRDARGDKIKPKTVGRKEIDRLNHTKNGTYRIFDRQNRITFELLYKFISDIHNQDLEIDIETEFKSALGIAAKELQEYWLLRELF
ncbi:MAG: exonuclease domain-containing protein, partial [Cyanobacteria bacterium J06623_7]